MSQGSKSKYSVNIFVLGPDLPCKLSDHSFTSLNESHSVLIGGNFEGRTYYYDHFHSTFTNGPNLIFGRFGHASGTVQDKETGEKFVVVSGGFSGSNTFLDSTEILINGHWTQGTYRTYSSAVLLSG